MPTAKLKKINQRAPSKPSAPSRALDVFPNPQADRDYLIHMQIPEFAHITLEYIADELCIELKSLKMYMWSFRDIGAFHEKVTNDMLTDFVKAVKPRYMRVTTRWWVRGGIYTNVVAEHKKKGWKGEIPKAQEFSVARAFA
jgi:7-cyano-7-deazaguanine reductase